MKKIKNIQQLTSEKKRIKNKTEYLEHRICNSWIEVKQSFKPANIAKDSFTELISNGNAGAVKKDNILKNTFTYGVGLLAGKLADKAGLKLAKLFKK
jgi:hypothetical protein